MNYKQTLDYLFSQLPMFQRVGTAAYKADLGNTIEISRRLGNPEQKFPAIHVAGTNGKGSVSHMIASVLQEAGYKTGLFTSPHLKDFRERIKVNGVMVPEPYIVDFVENKKEILQDIQPSFFEYTFAMCMQYFADENVDIAVVEVGMGGRLDSTNVIRPLISIITNIGLDHIRFLGNTREQIAREKAGIINQGIPVIIGESQTETELVFRHIAEGKSSKILFADQKYKSLAIETEQGLSMDLKPNNENSSFEILIRLHMPLAGAYQQKNIVTAIVAIQEIAEKLDITKSHIYEGFRNVVTNTGILGRWQVLQDNPRIICDTGHNEDGIKSNVSQLEKLEFNQLHFVLGMVNDKDINKILELLPTYATYYFCKADIPRGLNQEKLKEEAWQKGLKGKSYPSVKLALQDARRMARPNDLIFVGGSTFVVAEVL